MIRYLRYWKNRLFMQKKKNIIAIVGTTGVGKSQFSIELAKAINGEIINADSMQMYKGLYQITNKHPIEEREGIRHHVMNHVDWDHDYHIHKFKQEADAAIEDIHSRGKTPIIVGGTHYYLSSLLFENKTISKSEEISEKKLTDEQLAFLDGPVEPIFKKLIEIDPIIAQKFHPQDKRKLRRALEIYYTTSQKTSDIYNKQKLEELEQSSLRFNTLLFWVYCDPETLKIRLDERVDKMMDQGAMEEIKEMYQKYTSFEIEPDMTNGVWQVIGFKEFLKWLNSNEKSDYEEGLEKMKIRTRQYAKKQIKWIKSLLATELSKESKFDYVYGGKLYLLDSTDLDKWGQNVSEQGIKICQQFIENGPNSVTFKQAPDHLLDVFPTEEYLKNLKSNKNLGASKDWKHFQCDVCLDKNGKPFTAVGEENFQIHLNGRKHKRAVGSNERKRKHQQMLEQYSK